MIAHAASALVLGAGLPGLLVAALLGAAIAAGGLVLAFRGRLKPSPHTASEALRFKALVEGSRDLMVLLAPDGTLIYTSPSIREVLGYNQDFNLNHEVWHLIHPDDIHDVWAALRKTTIADPNLQEGPAGEGISFRIRHADGKWRWMEAKATNHLADRGISAIVVVCHDVSTRVRSQHQLQDDLARISGILNSTGDALVALNESDQIVLFNRAAEQMFEREADGVLGERIDLLLHRGMRDGNADLAVRLESLSDDDVRVVQVLAERPSDGPFPAEIAATRAEINRRSVLVLSIRDVTPRMEIQRALIEREASMRDAFDLAGAGMLLVEPDGSIRRANESISVMLGIEVKEIEKMKLADLVDPDDLKEDMDNFRRLVRREIPFYQSTRRYMRGDQSSLIVRQSVSEVTGDSGLPEFFVVTVDDVTDEAARTRALEDAEQRFEVVFEEAPLGTAVIDFRERAVHVNRAMRRLYGFSRGARHDVSVADLANSEGIDPRAFAVFVGRTDLAKLGSNLEAVFAGEVDRFRLEHVLERSDGREIPALVSVSMTRDDEGPYYLIVQVEEISAQKEREALLAQAASHDGLTGLPNRTLFVERLRQGLARIARGHGSLAVLFLDIDDFKKVNDGLGHAQGDELLAAFAYRLRHAVRESDLVSRFGGDEFVVLCEDLSHPQEAEDVAKRIIEAVADGFVVSSGEIDSTASIGVAEADTDERPGEVIRRADLAMYEAKKAGKNRYVVAPRGPHLDSQDADGLGTRPSISRSTSIDEVLESP